jgi:hypothetical protein
MGRATSKLLANGRIAGGRCSRIIGPPAGNHNVPASAALIAAPPPAIASGVGRPDMRRTARNSVCAGRILTLPLRDTAATRASSTPGRSTLTSHRPGASSLCTIGPAARSRVPLRLCPARYLSRRCNAVARARSGSPLTQVCTEKPVWICRISTAPWYETTVSGLASLSWSHRLCGRSKRGRYSSSRTARPVLPRGLVAVRRVITASAPAMCACRDICARQGALPFSIRYRAAARGRAIGHRIDRETQQAEQ